MIIPPDVCVVYGQIMLLNNEGETLYSIGEPWERVKVRFKQNMCIPQPGAMHRHRLFEQHGNFDESFRIAGDYELLLRELKTGDAVFIPDLIMIGMRQGGISSDPANALAAMREVRLAQRKHGQLLPGLLWLVAMARVYVRLLLWRLLGEKAARRVLDFGRQLMGKPPFWGRT